MAAIRNSAATHPTFPANAPATHSECKSERVTSEQSPAMNKISPRYFVLPLLALVVIGSLPAPADSGRVQRAGGCGPAASSVTDPGLRAEFETFERRQSAAAAKNCALYRNSAP
jgi:hypothetical protein